jgi:hypothetical protein
MAEIGNWRMTSPPNPLSSAEERGLIKKCSFIPPSPVYRRRGLGG